MRDDWTISQLESIPDTFYTAEETVKNVRENFDIRRFYSSEGKDIEINGSKCRCLVQMPSNPLRELNDYRKIHCPINADVKRGYYVNYEGTVWIIDTNVADVDGAYLSTRMSRCNNLLRWQDKEGNIVEKWAYNSDQTKYSNGEAGKDEIVVGDNQYAMLLPIDKDTKLLRRGMRFAVDFEDSDDPDIYRLTNRKVNLNNETYFNRGGTLSITLSLDFLDRNADKRIPLSSGKTAWICNYNGTPSSTLHPPGMADVKALISGNTGLRNGYSRTYSASFFDKGNNEVDLNMQNYQWNIISEFDVAHTTNGNKITVSVNDESLIGASFFIELVVGNTAASKIKVNILE